MAGITQVMGDYVTKKGLDIHLAGKPSGEVVSIPDDARVAVHPAEFRGVRPKLLVKEGDRVLRGTPLFRCKHLPSFTYGAPAAGIVRRITLGERRALEEIFIERDGPDEAVSFGAHGPDALASLSRDEVVRQLSASGYLAFLVRRPFGGLVRPHIIPKSIFINAISTAPYQASPGVALEGQETEFQAGVDVLTRLTEGPVHLCRAKDETSTVLCRARGVQHHTFTGPHPAGNSSVHIERIDPMKPNDTVWTVSADHVALIGALFLTGELPTHRVVSLGGPGVKSGDCRHYRMRIGGRIGPLVADRLNEGEQRLVAGDLFMGQTVSGDGYMPLHAAGLTVLPENRSRRFLGWLTPGWDRFSYSPLFLSHWRSKAREWRLSTNDSGGWRAMFATGIYDRFLPMDILVDFLVRAVLAHDTDEAVQLGILETLPEDFALCAYACPSRTDLVSIIQDGLDEIEAEGLYGAANSSEYEPGSAVDTAR